MPRQLPWNQPRQPDFEDLNGTNNLDFIDLISNDGLDDEPIDYDSDGLEEPDGDDFWPNSELVLAYRERRALARQTASGMVPVNPPRCRVIPSIITMIWLLMLVILDTQSRRPRTLHRLSYPLRRHPLRRRPSTL